MKNKLLIIGHTGFVGTNITEYLKLHYDIYGLSRNDIYGLSKNDIYNKYDFNTFFAIIFLAGLAHDEESSFDSYYKSNFDNLKFYYDIFLQYFMNWFHTSHLVSFISTFAVEYF